MTEKDAERQPICAHCGIKKAACYGSYENERPSYACDDCCGHGCEDGRCWSIQSLES